GISLPRAIPCRSAQHDNTSDLRQDPSLNDLDAVTRVGRETKIVTIMSLPVEHRSQPFHGQILVLTHERRTWDRQSIRDRPLEVGRVSPFSTVLLVPVSLLPALLAFFLFALLAELFPLLGCEPLPGADLGGHEPGSRIEGAGSTQPGHGAELVEH